MHRLLILFLLSFCALNFAHEGHYAQNQTLESIHPGAMQPTIKEFGGKPANWSQWVGTFHLIFLHFPIALITLIVFAEILYLWHPNPLFEHSARFMLYATAILGIPTAILGYIYSYGGSYEGFLDTILDLHMSFGIATALLSLVVLYIREYQGLGWVYYTSLLLLFVVVNMAGLFGGALSFGPYHFFPPI